MASTNKTAFIKSLPVDLTVEQIIDAGKKQGVTLSRDFVLIVRGSKLRAGGNEETRRHEARRAHLRSTPAVPKETARPPKGSTKSVEAQEKILMEAILDLGLARVEELIAKLKGTLGVAR